MSRQATSSRSRRISKREIGDSLRTALEKSGIDEAQSIELRGTLQHEKTMEDVKGWIRRNAGKVVEKGLEVGTNIGAKVLTELITTYLGLPPTAK
jgi:hypothetical protein